MAIFLTALILVSFGGAAADGQNLDRKTADD